MAVLMQIRVKPQLAENFKHAAKRRGKTPNAYLRQVVKQAARLDAPGSKNHRRPVANLKSIRLPYNLVARLRVDDDE
jgi:predicted DNA-binding protein